MNGISWARLIGVAVVAVVAQVSILDDVVVFGAHPDVMVVLAAAAGVVGGPVRGAVIGIVLGAFADLALPLPFGYSMLTFVLVGFGSSYLLRAASGRDVPATELATTVVASGMGTILYALAAAVVGEPGMVGPVLIRATVVVVAGAVLLGLPALAVDRWIVEPSSASVLGGIGGG